MNSKPTIDPKECREAVWKEILYRRNKQWSIFSWATSLLLAAIAGIVGVTIKEGYELSSEQKASLVAALSLLTLYAWRWLGENIRREDHATKRIKEIDEELGIGDIFTEFPLILGERRIYFGYRFIVAGVGLVAIATVIRAPVRARHVLSLTYKPDAKSTIVLQVPSREQQFNDIDTATNAFQEEAKKHFQ
jgi:hypothetical protein